MTGAMIYLLGIIKRVTCFEEHRKLRQKIIQKLRASPFQPSGRWASLALTCTLVVLSTVSVVRVHAITGTCKGQG